jgi:hypothetical protein
VNETPDGAGPERVWEPRILEAPILNQSIKNNFVGVFSSSASKLSLINNDNDFQQHLNESASWNDADVKIWMCINDTTNIQKMYTGKVKNLSIIAKQVTFTFYDSFSRLNQPALMGDPADDAYFLTESSSFTAVDPKEDGTPVPMIFAESSIYQKSREQIESLTIVDNGNNENEIPFDEGSGVIRAVIPVGTYSFADLASEIDTQMEAVGSKTYTVSFNTTTRKFSITVSSGTFDILWTNDPFKVDAINELMGFDYSDDIGVTTATSDDPVPYSETRLDDSFMNKAVCTDTSDQKAKNANREWGLCRFNSDGPRVTKISNAANPVLNILHNFYSGKAIMYVQFDLTGASPANTLVVGDSIKWEDTSANIRYLLCTEDQSFTFNGTTYTHAFQVFNGLGSGVILGAASETWNTNDAPGLVIKHKTSGDRYYPVYEYHFTETVSTLTSGNKYQKVTFEDNFEDLDLGWDTAASALNPNDYEVFYRTGCDTSNLGHSDVLKKIVEDAGLTADTTSFTAAQTESDTNCWFQIPEHDQSDFGSYRSYAEKILQSIFGIIYPDNNFKISYKLLSRRFDVDLITDPNLYLRNSFNISVDYNDIITKIIPYNDHKPDADPIEENNRSKFKHGIENEIRVRHVLESFPRADDIFDFRTNPTITYSWDEATDKLDAFLGDFLRIDSPEVFGYLSQPRTQIVTIDKSAKRTSIQANVIVFYPDEE